MCCAAGGIGEIPLATTPGFTNSLRARKAVHPDGLFRLTNTSDVFLTFDDGPDPDYTPAVLDKLQRLSLPAVFFVVGNNAERYPELIGRILREGHSLANHTTTHVDLQTVNMARIETELTGWSEVIEGIDAPHQRWLRPPMGHTCDAVASAAARHTLRPVFWDVCIERFVSTDNFRSGIDRCVHEIRPGSIVLGHDGGKIVGTDQPSFDRSATVEALEAIVAGVRAKGRDFGVLPDAVSRLRQH